MKRHHGLAIMVAVGFWLVSGGASMVCADPFSSAPGTRARAMGGAFCGIADDFSAVWYNPAGLAGMEKKAKKKSAAASRHFQLVTEWAQAASVQDESGDLETDNAWFFGGIYQAPEYATGLFYYTPYVINYRAYDNRGNDVAWGRIEESIQVFSVPIALNLPVFQDKFRFGGTLDWVRADIGGSQILYRDLTGFAEGYEAESGKESKLSGSLSILLTPVDTGAFKLNLGAVYRLEGGTDIGEAAMRSGSDQGVGRLFFDRPASLDIGLGLTSVFEAGKTDYELNVGLQYGRTDWGGATVDGDLDYNRYSAGVELAILREKERLNRIALRAGYFMSDPSGENPANQEWPDVTGITYGVGLRMGQVFLDVAQEYVTHDGSTDDSVLLTSAAISLSF